MLARRRCVRSKFAEEVEERDRISEGAAAAIDDCGEGFRAKFGWDTATSELPALTDWALRGVRRLPAGATEAPVRQAAQQRRPVQALDGKMGGLAESEEDAPTSMDAAVLPGDDSGEVCPRLNNVAASDVARMKLLAESSQGEGTQPNPAPLRNWREKTQAASAKSKPPAKTIRSYMMGVGLRTVADARSLDVVEEDDMDGLPGLYWPRTMISGWDPERPRARPAGGSRS